MSLFKEIPKIALNRSFAALEAFKTDNHASKAFLWPGFYYDENGNSWVLPSVKMARAILEADPHLNYDLQPQAGYPGFVSAAQQLAFGALAQSRAITSMQTIAGTGANHFVARFVSDTLQPKHVWFSDPTWENHSEIWKLVSPAIEQRYYPYYDSETSALDINGLIQTLREHALSGDAIVLHACAHNPTGLDPSREQWEAIAAICKEKGLFPIFDSSYQGFATGSPDDDAWVVRHFATCSKGTKEFAVAQSFSKNFGLYGERVGALHIVSRDHDSADRVAGALKSIHRAEITSAPSFGAKIVSTIFQNPELKEQWYKDLKTMNDRLTDMRRRLYDELVKRNTPGNWAHLLTDIGMFSYTGISEQKVDILKDRFHVYIFPTGRLAFTGLTKNNVEYVAESINKVLLGEY